MIFKVYARHVALCIFMAIASGCSTPPTAIPKISSLLSESCRRLMTSSGIMDYQYTVQSPVGKGVFALAKEGDSQVCATSTVRDGISEWTGLEQLAISRCEDQRRNTGISTPCKIFARNFEVVWFEDPNEKFALAEKAENIRKNNLQQKEDEANKRRMVDEQERMLRERKFAEEAEALRRSEEDRKTTELAQAKEDDKKCLSFGAKSGTQAYILCRATMTASRADLLERQSSNKAMEQRIEGLKNQLESQEKVRAAANEKSEREQKQANAAIQQAMEAEKKRREKNANIEAAQRYFDLAAKLSQPQQPSKSSSQTYIINGRTINCNTIGNLTDCR